MLKFLADENFNRDIVRRKRKSRIKWQSKRIFKNEVANGKLRN